MLSSTGLTSSLTDMDLLFTQRKQVLHTDSAALSLSLLQEKKNTEERLEISQHAQGEDTGGAG